MKIIDAIERQPISVPISSVWSKEDGFQFLPEVTEKGYFDIDYRKNELVLVAGKYIGQVPLTKEIVINVLPKAPINNLARIVGAANQPVKCLDFFRRKYSLEPKASENILEAISRSFILSLRQITNEGVYREYSGRRSVLNGIRGRVELGGYLRRSVPQARFTEVPCRYFELTIDTVFNRIIKLAIHEVAIALGLSNKRMAHIKAELAYFADLFDTIPIDRSPQLLEQVRQALKSQHLPQLRHYYLDVLDICLVILAGSGVELGRTEGIVGLHSLMVNLEDAFEHYLRNTLHDRCLDFGLKIKDGNTDGLSNLFDDNDKFKAKPDLILLSGPHTVALGDVKYKNKLTETDRYQLISHCLAFKSKVGFFAIPAATATRSGPEYLGHIGAGDGIKIYQYHFDMESQELEKEETKMVEWISTLSSNPGEV